MRRGNRPRILLALGLLTLAAFFLFGTHGWHDAPKNAAAPAPAGRAPRTLTLTFWNLEWFPGRRPNASETARQQHVAAVVPVVERLDPDVLGLEEVNGADAARLITDHLKGFRVDVCSDYLRRGLPSGQQIALCSRLPLETAGWEPWRPGADGLQAPRGFVFAVYRPAPGEWLLVYALHLKSNVVDEPGGAAVNGPMRGESARQLLAHERTLEAAYRKKGQVRLAVVGGDMNTSLDDSRFGGESTLRLWLGEGGFRWAWQDVPLERRLTLPAKGRYPAVCFDHQFYRTPDGGGPRAQPAPVEDTGRAASDHRPVTVRYEW